MWVLALAVSGPLPRSVNPDLQTQSNLQSLMPCARYQFTLSSLKTQTANPYKNTKTTIPRPHPPPPVSPAACTSQVAEQSACNLFRVWRVLPYLQSSQLGPGDSAIKFGILRFRGSRFWDCRLIYGWALRISMTMPTLTLAVLSCWLRAV